MVKGDIQPSVLEGCVGENKAVSFVRPRRWSHAAEGLHCLCGTCALVILWLLSGGLIRMKWAGLRRALMVMPCLLTIA